jgi:hypothetical protein
VLLGAATGRWGYVGFGFADFLERVEDVPCSFVADR